MYSSNPFVIPDSLQRLPLLHQGKVRNLYAVDAAHLLLVATDRLSAFDVILPDPIPGKGEILTAISRFWWDFFADIPNHLSQTRTLAEVLMAEEFSALAKRSVLVRNLKPLPIEAVVRGYLAGSGFKDYQKSQSIQGQVLPKDLRLADKLPAPLFTPTTKAPVGEKDLALTLPEYFDYLEKVLTASPWHKTKAEAVAIAEAVQAQSLAIYQRAHDFLWEKDLLLADTKLEWSVDAQGLVLIDELLTPDSSRYWPRQGWQPGENPPSLDKQGIRDYLASFSWQTPPTLPKWLIEDTQRRYRELAEKLAIV
jgi:phosphoribosylaminoimidazole-succinocarboxamide synthase